MPDSSSEDHIDAPTLLGVLTVRQTLGRCQADGCKRKGGGMLKFTYTEKIAEGIEEEMHKRLCGPCVVEMLGVRE